MGLDPDFDFIEPAPYLHSLTSALDSDYADFLLPIILLPIHSQKERAASFHSVSASEVFMTCPCFLLSGVE